MTAAGPTPAPLPAHLVVDLFVDLFVDIVCPWCFVGNERLERVLASAAPGSRQAIVRHHPFFLDPSTPLEGRNVPEMLRQKYGADPKRLWARVEAEARKAGIELDLAKQPNAYPTARAHTLVRHAEGRGTGRALVRDLYRAYFLDARNIADPDVLADVAVRHGFAREEAAGLVTDEAELDLTRGQAREAAASGIGGVPFFIFDGRLAVSGAQPEDVLREAMGRADQEARSSVR
jgi:predicted DsbA family dithiol-disulfide isomerase